MHFVQFITSFSALSQYFWRTVGKCTIRILFLLSCIPPCPRSRHFEKVSFKRIINNSSTIRSPLYILIDQLSALPIDQETLISVTCEQALRGTLAAGQEKERELATTSLEFVFHLQFPCGSSSTELSDFCQSAHSRNECECTQTLARYVPRIKATSANQHFTLTFLMQIFQFQRRS